MKRLFRPETVFFLLTWLGLMVAFRDRGFYDPGALWHIKVGEIIVEQGIPQTDPFSYTFEGQRWVPQQWGAEVLMAVVHRHGGLDALLLGFAAGVAFLYTLIFRRCVQGGMGPILAGVIVGGVLCVGAFHYFVRPHMFTIGFLAWTMMCVIDYERGRCTEWRLAGLIPLYILWVNLHGGVLGGTMTLGCAVAGWGLVFLLGERRGVSPPVDGDDNDRRAHAAPLTPIKSWRIAFLLVAIVAACGLTPFVNPHGMEMIRIWQRIVGSKVLPQVVNEHMPLDPTSPLGLMVIALGAFYLFMLAGTLLPGASPALANSRDLAGPAGAPPALASFRDLAGRCRLPHVSWLIPLVWFVLSFKGIRQGPLFAVCAGVALADLWKHTLWHRLLVKHGDGSTAWNADDAGESQRRFSPLWAALLIPAFFVAVSAKLQAHKVEVPVVGSGWARLDPDFIPSDMTREVREYAASVPPGTPIFNDANLGGYLIYHTPNLKIFMDDRCELYGDEWIKGYSEAMGLPPEELGPLFEQWAKQYKFERAFVMTNPPELEKPPIERYLSGAPGWREVARGKRAVMYERVR